MASADPKIHSVAAGPILPSERCERREEWQQTCLMWSGRSRDRYLTVGQIDPNDGVGASLRLIGTAIDMALSFDLELDLTGPFLASHGVGDWGAWFGLVGNYTSTILDLRNPEGYLGATTEGLKPHMHGREEWLLSQENRTSVSFVPNMMKIGVIDWGAPATPGPSRYDNRVCTYARQVLRQIYWGRKKERDRCHSFLPGHPALGAGNGSIAGKNRFASCHLSILCSLLTLLPANLEGYIRNLDTKRAHFVCACTGQNTRSLNMWEVTYASPLRLCMLR